MSAEPARKPMTDEEIEAHLSAPHPFREPPSPEDEEAWMEWAHEWIRHPAFRAYCEAQVPPRELADYFKRRAAR